MSNSAIQNKNPQMTFIETLKKAIDSYLTEVHTSTIGKVQTYYPATQTADIQPLVKKVYFDGRASALPPLLPKVLMSPLRTKNAYIHLPVASGDIVMVFFTERSLDKVVIAGSAQDPKDLRKFSINDAFAIPYDPTQPNKLTLNNPDDIEIVNNKGRTSIKPNGDFEIIDSTNNFKIKLASGKIAIGISGIELLDKIASFADNVSTYANAAKTHVHPTAVGPSSAPVDQSPWTTLKSDADAIKTAINSIKGSI